MPLKLRKREKIAVGVAAGCLILFLILQLVIFPVLDQKKRHQRSIQSKKLALQEILFLKSEYEALQAKAGLSHKRLSQRDKNFTLFSFLDRLVRESGLKGNITYMKPTSTPKSSGPFKITAVEMKLQTITMEQLTTYLYKVETSKNEVNVKRISIAKAGKQAGYIDAVLQVETFEI